MGDSMPAAALPRGAATALDAALARSDAFRLLAAALRDPDGPDRPDLELPDLVDALADLGVGPDAMEVAALAAIAEPEARAAGHRRLFGHTVAHGCPPYETEYGGRHVFGQAQDLADIAGYYAAFGLGPAPQGERVDHLACELEFLAILAIKEAAAAAAQQADRVELCRAAEASFLRDHLGRWLPALSGTAQHQAPGSGHAVLLGLAARLVERRAAELGVRVDRLGPDARRPIEDEPDGFQFECGAADAGPGLAVPG
jgi:TorA maturation chaperone TorD